MISTTALKTPITTGAKQAAGKSNRGSRMNKAVMRLSTLWVLLQSPLLAAHTFEQQTELKTFASQSQFQLAVVSNKQASGGFAGKLKLDNKSTVDLAAGSGNWQIYLHFIRKLKAPEQFGLKLEHVQGDLHRIIPTKNFKGLKQGEALEFNYSGGANIIS